MGSCRKWVLLSPFHISLEVAKLQDPRFFTFTGVGVTKRKLTQQNKEHPSQLGSPILGHSRLVAHTDAGENCQQQQDGRQAQNRGSNHEGSTSLHIAWEQESREGGLDQGVVLLPLSATSQELHTTFLPLLVPSKTSDLINVVQDQPTPSTQGDC